MLQKTKLWIYTQKDIACKQPLKYKKTPGWTQQMFCRYFEISGLRIACSCTQAKEKAQENSCKENEVKKVQLALESVEIQEILDLGEVFSEQTSKRLGAERLLLNPLNHPAAMAFFALIRKP